MDECGFESWGHFWPGDCGGGNDSRLEVEYSQETIPGVHETSGNRIAASAQSTSGVEGFAFQGADGSAIVEPTKQSGDDPTTHNGDIASHDQGVGGGPTRGANVSQEMANAESQTP